MSAAALPEARPPSARALLRLRHGTRGPSIGARVEQVYTGLLVSAILLAVLWGTAGDAVSDLLTPERWASWGIPVLAAVVVGLARFGIWQGPVAFKPADVALLLSAPVRRAAFVRFQLVRLLALGAVLGAVLGVAGIAFTAVSGARPEGTQWAAGIAACAAVGVLAVALSWLVESSPGAARGLARAALLPWAAVAALAVAGGVGGTPRTVALWSGPWGWAVAAGDRTGTAALAGLAATVVLTALVTALAWARAGTGTLEGFALRASARSSVVASAAFADFRTARRSRARTAGQITGPRGRTRSAGRVAGPPRAGLGSALVWRDLLALRADRTRPVVAAALAAGAALAAAAHPDRAAWAAGAAVAAFLAASRLVEPARTEFDAPDRAQLLLGRDARSLALDHARVPGALLLTASTLGLVAGVATGAVDVSTALTAVFVSVFAWGFALLCALNAAAQGGGVPLSVLSIAASDTSGSGLLIVVAYLLLWPVLTVAVVLVAILLAGAHAPPTAALILLAVGVGGTLAWLRRPADLGLGGDADD